MRNALEAFTYAAGENLASPDRTIIPIASSVETDPDDALFPGTKLGQYGSNMSAVMLHGALFRGRKLRCIYRRNILGMRVVNEQQFVRINFIHRKQVLDGLPEGAEGFVVIQITNVL